MHIRNTAIMAVILVGLAAFVYFHEIRGREERELAEKEASKLVLFELEAVTGVELATADGAVAAVRADGRWRITTPRAIEADSAALDDLVDALHTARQERLIADPADDLSAFGLDTPGVTITLTLGEDAPLTVTLGEDTPIGANLYAAVNGTKVYAAPRDLRFALDKKLLDLRDRTVIAFEQDAVRRIDLDTEVFSARLQRQDDGGDEPRWTASAPFAGRADADSIDDLLTALGTAEAEGFVLDLAPDGEQRAAYGLDAPLATLTLWTTDDASQELIIGAESTEPAGRFAARAGGNAVFVVGNDLIDDLPKSIDDLRNKQVLAVERSDVRAIELLHGSVDARLDRAGADWSLTRPRQLEADASAVSGLISTLQDLRAASFGAQLGSTELQVRLLLGTDEAPETLEVRVGAVTRVPPPADSGDAEPVAVRPVKASDDDTVYMVAEDEVADLFADIFELRAKTLVEFDNSAVERIALETSDGDSWQLTRDGEEWKVEGIDEFDSSVASDLLWDLNYLRMEQVGREWQDDAPDLSEYGLVAPRFRIVAEGAEGAVTRVEIGGEVTDTVTGPSSVWVRVDGVAGVFAVTARVAEAAQALADALRRTP